MVSSDGLTEPDPKVVAAARAAASWGRARRATWTNAPLPVYVPSADEIARAAARQAPQPPPPPPKPAGPPMGERIGAVAGPAMKYGLGLGVVAALGFGAFKAYPSVMEMLKSKPAATEPAAEGTTPPDGKPPQTTARGTARGGGSPGAGSAPATIDIKSTPPGAQIFVDGKPRGSTPFVLRDITPGKHVVELRAKEGSVERTLTMESGATEFIDEQIFPGWVGVLSPIEISITEDGRPLRPDDRGQVILAPGKHDLRFANTKLEFESLQKVVVKPGEVTKVNITPPRTSISVTTSEPAEVFVDGSKLGDTPLNGVALDLGTHEVLVKRVGGGERRYNVTATTRPITLNVDFAR